MNKDKYLIWLSKTDTMTYTEKIDAISKGEALETLYKNAQSKGEADLLERCQSILSMHEREGVGMLSFDHPCFKTGMPIVTYYLGTPHIGKQAAVIGARDCSAEGYYHTPDVVAHYLNQGFAVNSGLAYGIDIMAHRETLNRNGITQAFVAHGLDQCYPKRHSWHFKEIVKKGCIYSQYEMGVQAQKFRFVERNQLMVNMSDEVFVVEAGAKSGALKTGFSALKQGKSTMTIEGPTDSIRCAGNMKLLKSGANKFDAKHYEWHGPLKGTVERLRDRPMTLEQLHKYVTCDIGTLDFYLFDIECHYWVSFKADGKWHYNGW